MQSSTTVKSCNFSASRKTFKKLLSYCRENASQIHALLFYKVDRAARNLLDYVELERLESDFGIEVIYVSQPTENSPAGRMQRRILASHTLESLAKELQNEGREYTPKR